jgi:putative redox protein
MKAKVTWTGPGLRMVGDSDGGPAIVIDSSKGDMGTHSGPSPMELVLLGLAGCTAMDVVSIMAKKRQPFTNLEVKVEAERADEHPRVFTKIHLEYIAYGTDVDELALCRAIELSEEKYCSAMGMLKQVTEMTSSYRVVEAANPSQPGAPLEEVQVDR